MKYFSALLLFVGLSFTSCSDEDTELPTCIDTLYSDFRANVCSGGDFTIWRFRGEDVYCFNWTCFSDGTSDIYDANCVLLCQLGGLAGNSDCLGLDWGSNASLQETVWVAP